MKKLIVILVAALSFTAASAQSRKDGYNRQDRYQVTPNQDSRYHNDQHRSNEYTYNNNNAYNKGGDGDRNRHADYDRMHQRYDQRRDGYRHDRSLSIYERNRGIRGTEQERQQKPGAFGSGLVIGGIAGLLIGVLAGH